MALEVTIPIKGPTEGQELVLRVYMKHFEVLHGIEDPGEAPLSLVFFTRSDTTRKELRLTLAKLGHPNADFRKVPQSRSTARARKHDLIHMAMIAFYTDLGVDALTTTILADTVRTTLTFGGDPRMLTALKEKLLVAKQHYALLAAELRAAAREIELQTRAPIAP